MLTTARDDTSTSSGESVIEEGEVRWLIHMCGGTVINDQNSGSSSSSNNRNRYEQNKHIILALRLRDEVPLFTRVSSSERAVSVSWLVDAICDQQLPVGERAAADSGWDGEVYSVPLKYYVEASSS